MVFLNKRYEKCNEPNTKNYDINKPEKHILFCDVNSLYSYALRSPLPVDDIIFLNDNEIRNFDLMSISNDTNFGFIVTVDLKIPNA